MACSCRRHPTQAEIERGEAFPGDYWAGVEDGLWQVHSSDYCRSLPRARWWHRFLWWLGNLCFRLAGPRAQERIAAFVEEREYRWKREMERKQREERRKALEAGYDKLTQENDDGES